MDKILITMTDKILFFAAIVFFWRGWSKGILRTIFGPLALVVCSAISYAYYLWTHDLAIAAAIGILGPILLNIIFSLLLNILGIAKDGERIGTPSRLVAGALNLIWGEFILIVTALTILMLPFPLPAITRIQNDIKQSSSYILIKPVLDQAFRQHNVQPIDPSKMATLGDPEKLKDIEKTDEYQSLVNDPRILAIFEDPALNEQIEKKDIAKMMQNPKIIELTRDPQLLKKFLALYSKMLQSQPAKTQ